MKNQRFTKFPIEDLTGGLNLRDFETEIDNKQCLRSENWNTEGDKIVSGKGYESIINKGTGVLQGLTKNIDDIYTVSNGNVYKNGTPLFLGNEYDVTFSSVNDNPFSISIDGVSKVYKITESSEANALITLLSTLQTDFPTYTITAVSNVFTFSKSGESITITNPGFVKKIEISDWNANVKLDITIDGVTYSATGADYSNDYDFLDYIVTQLSASYKTKRVGSVLYIGKQHTDVVITKTEYDRYTYNLVGYRSSINPSSTNLGGNQGSASCNYTTIKTTLDGIEYTFSPGFGVGWDTSPTSVSYNFNNISALGTQTIYATNTHSIGLMNHIINNASGYVFGSVFTINTSDWHYGIPIRKSDYSAINYTNTTVRYYIGTISPFYYDYNYGFPLAATVNHATCTITSTQLTTWNSTNTGLKINSDNFYDININNYGILLVNKNGYETVFISNAGVVTELSFSSVGAPSVGTIYNGKTILGGYKNGGIDNDNIVFSKTATPSTVNNLTVFTGYDAGAQSVSGGNGGKITGFIVNEDGLLVFKDNEIWKTNSENNNGTVFNFRFNKITSTGALNQATITPVQQDIFYYDHKNRCVRRLAYEQNMQTLRDTNISKEVESYFKAIPDDDEENDERYSTLINSSFFYPYYTINITSDTSEDLYLSGINENYKYKVPNIQLVYNVENSSWTTRTDFTKENLYPIMSYNGIVGTTGVYIYKDFVGNTNEEGVFLSKKYTIDGFDSTIKKIGQVDIIGKIIPETGQTKELQIDVLIDDEIVATRVVSVTTTQKIIQKIDLYNLGKTIQLKFTHSGNGKVEIVDAYFYFRPTKIYGNNYH